MDLFETTGDLMHSVADVIAHQTNCKGAFASGVAKSVRMRFPIVAQQYEEVCRDNIVKGYDSSHLLGRVQYVPVGNGQIVANLFAQNNYGGDGGRYTSYDAMMECLEGLRNYCVKNNKKSVAFPCRIGSFRGGANWNVIKTMITEVFKDTDIRVEIWEYKE